MTSIISFDNNIDDVLDISQLHTDMYINCT
jgi:hypothetical protein